MSAELREQVVRALHGVMEAVASPIGRLSVNRLADAVMAKVEPLVEQLRQAEVSRDAYRDERDQTQRERDQLLTERSAWEQRLSDVQEEHRKHAESWDRTRERLTRERAELRWLHAESAWRLGNSEDSRFRWAEEAAALQQQRRVLWDLCKKVARFAMMARCKSCHDDGKELATLRASAVVLPADDEEQLADLLETKERQIVILDVGNIEFDAQYAAHLALDLVRSWRPATVEAAPVEQTRDEMVAESIARIGEAIDAQEPACSCDATGAPEFPHRDWCELNHPHHPCDARSCKFHAERPLCEKCRQFPVWRRDRPGDYMGHFCARCVGQCHDMSDESSVHMCVIDRWTPPAAGVSGTGTEAAPLADLTEAEFREFHAGALSARSQAEPDGAAQIVAERRRVVTAKGYDAAHDDQHVHGELLDAARCYANQGRTSFQPFTYKYGADAGALLDQGWPWWTGDEPEGWKPAGNPVENLAQAGQFIAAEIDRLKRAERGDQS